MCAAHVKFEEITIFVWIRVDETLKSVINAVFFFLFSLFSYGMNCIVCDLDCINVLVFHKYLCIYNVHWYIDVIIIYIGTRTRNQVTKFTCLIISSDSQYIMQNCSFIFLVA